MDAQLQKKQVKSKNRKKVEFRNDAYPTGDGILIGAMLKIWFVSFKTGAVQLTFKPSSAATTRFTSS